MLFSWLPLHDVAPHAADEAMSTVLVVDDEPGVRRITARFLRSAGHTVVEASDGFDAWRHLQAQASSIDVLLTDVMMPRMSGTELAARVHEHRPDLPIVFMSGYTSTELTARGLDRAKGVLLTKPFGPDTLLALVDQVLGRAGMSVDEQSQADHCPA